MNKKKFMSLVLAVVFAVTVTSNLSAPGIPVQAGSSAKEDGLVAHWTFDDDYTDSASGLTTNLGAKKLTYTQGIFGKAAAFNGKDNYLVVDADPILNLGNDSEENNDNFTISAWINLGDSSSTYKYLLDKGDNSNWEKEDGCYWTNPYRISFNICEPIVELSNEYQDTNADPDYVTEGTSTTSGKYVEGQEWFLFTMTYDGKRVKIYHDNELLTQTNYTDGIAFNNEDLYIGVDHSLKYFFKGAVDDLKIYTKTLSYDEVDALYQKGLEANKELVEPTKQLIAYYPFDDTLEDKSIFQNNAQKVAVGGTTKYIAGKNGKAITMSKGNYILVPAADQLNFDTEFSVSFWIKLNADVAEGSYPVLYRQNPSNAQENDNEWTYRLYTSTWAELENTRLSITTTLYSPDNWTPEYGQDLATDVTLSENKIKSSDWIQYTATYKNGELKAYVNGLLKEKNQISDMINIENASGDLLIGYDGDTFINGAIDELKICNSCLSATEVEKEYQRVDSISLRKGDSDKLTKLGKGSSVTISSILLYDVDADKNVEINLSNKNYTFITSNKKILSVTAEGKVTGVKAGKAKLTIIYGGNTVTYNVVVK